VGVPQVELSIVNTSLLVEWSVLPPEKARGRLTEYQILLRQAHTVNQQPAVITVVNVRQHVIDGMTLFVICYFQTHSALVITALLPMPHLTEDQVTLKS